MSQLTGRTPLRLHVSSTARPVRPASQRVQRPTTPLTPADPRWVLAVRAAEAMQGPVLVPDDRDHLINIGRMLGLNAFQSNLVIAIVQDQARRGLGPSHAASELSFVPLSQPNTHSHAWRVAMVAGIVVAVEALIMWVLL